MSVAVREPAVAGLFYPAQPEVLAATVDALLAQAQPRALRPKAMILPHAGYVYSGPVAASGYVLLAPIADEIRRVVLLGPAHRVPLRGLAVPLARAFTTPLGTVEVDRDAIGRLAGLPQVTASDLPHAPEHALEAHLPFLQRLLPAFSIVPLVVGDAGPDAVAEVIERLDDGDGTLILVSSDLSHYLPWAVARSVDADTVQQILSLDASIRPEQACGAYPINGLLTVAQARGLAPRLVDLRNSGDTAGDRRAVVGYCAIAFTEDGHVH